MTPFDPLFSSRVTCKGPWKLLETHGSAGEWHAGGGLLLRVDHAEADGQIPGRVVDDRVGNLLLLRAAQNVLQKYSCVWSGRSKI